MKKNELIPFNAALATKNGRETVATSVLQKIEEGELDPVNVLIESRKWADLFKLLEKNEKFIEVIRDVLNKTGGKNIVVYGNKIEQAEVGVEYHYELTNDPVYAKLKYDRDEIDAALKEREKFLKGVSTKGQEILDPGTGEVVIVYPPYKTSKSSFKVTLNK